MAGYKSSINTGLPNLPDPPDPAFMAEFIRLYNAIRNLAIGIDSYTGGLGADPEAYSTTPPTSTILLQNMLRVYVKFDTAATYGKTVYLYHNAGILTAGLSDATSATKKARGWCNATAGVASGAYGEVMLGGLCTAIGGLTPGTTYYCGNTPGTLAATPGTNSQKFGYAIGTSMLFVQPEL